MIEKSVYEFTKKASRTAYEEAIRTGDGGSVENHRHPDYSLVDHTHDEAGEHTHDEFALKAHSHPSTSAPVVILTQAEFDELENKSEGTLYVVM